MSIQCSKDLRSRLRSFVSGENPEVAFREIADELGGLIYHSALRQSGDATIAEEVTQKVFLLIARQAGKLVGHPEILAWVHRTTRNKVLEMLRADLRRKKREAAAMKDQEERESVSERLLEELDEGLDRLSGPEREVILMKFFEGETYPVISSRTGRSESAEKMRVKRALEKMAGWLGKKGVTLSVAGLTTVLSTEMGKAAPLGVVFVAGSGKVVTAGVGSGKLAVGVTLLVAAGFAVPISAAWREVRELERDRSRMLDAEVESSGRARTMSFGSRGRHWTEQVRFDATEDEWNLSMDDLVWRYQVAADELNDDLAVERLNSRVEKMSREDLTEFCSRIGINRTASLSKHLESVMDPLEYLEFLIATGASDKSVHDYFYYDAPALEAAKWLVAKDQAGEIQSKSGRHEYRQKLWWAMLKKSEDLAEEGGLPGEVLEAIKVGSRLAPKGILRERFLKLQKTVRDGEGGGQ